MKINKKRTVVAAFISALFLIGSGFTANKIGKVLGNWIVEEEA